MKDSRSTTLTSLATSAAFTSPNGTITSSSSTSSPSSKMTRCEQCAQYVKDIFHRRPDSRPLEMLRAMGAITKPNSQDIHIHPVPNGMAVAIPSALKQTSVTPPATTTTTKTTTMESSTIQATSSLKNATPPPSSSLLQSSLEKIIIMCRPCSDDGPEGHARSFMAGPNPSHVVLCSNRLDLSNRQEVEEVLIHELVHAYDAHVQQLDFTSCVGLAYSEVRAAREAECAHTWMMPGHCVKTTAIRATNNMFPGLGRDCVQQVFTTAMADRHPIPLAAATGRGTSATAAAAAASTAASSAATATSPSITLNHHPSLNRHPRTRQPGHHRRNDNKDSSNNISNSKNNNHLLPRSLSIQQQRHSQR